ncbi:hypothetical protein ACXR2T_10240 [Leucobacter sp. HY1910]
MSTKDQITLFASRGARFRYMLGGRPARITLVSTVLAGMITGGVLGGPSLVDGFRELTGIYTEEELEAAKQLAADRAEAQSSLSTELAAAEAELEELAGGKLKSKGITTAKKGLAQYVSDASALLTDEDAEPSAILAARDDLARGRETLAASVQAEEKRLDTEKAKAVAAKKKRDAAAAKKKQEQEAKAAAEQAELDRQAQEEAAQQQQWDDGSYAPPPSTPTAPPPVAPPPPETAPVASTSLPVSCPVPTSVTFTAVGGGTVSISAGGASNSGAGSASVTVTVSGSATAFATGSGSISIGATAC